MEQIEKEDPMNDYIKIQTEKGKDCYLESDKYVLHYSNKLKNGDKNI